jgi:hypothetical protein
MRRIAKVTAARLPLRRAATGLAALRRPFPAWIDAEQGLAFSALTGTTVTARVRSGLVLRSVSSPQPKQPRRSDDVRGTR